MSSEGLITRSDSEGPSSAQPQSDFRKPEGTVTRLEGILVPRSGPCDY